MNLRTYLVFASALTASDPFDAMAAFKLLKTIDDALDLPTESHMAAAVEASLAALDAREVHSAAVARYALERVVVELERRLGTAAS